MEPHDAVPRKLPVLLILELQVSTAEIDRAEKFLDLLLLDVERQAAKPQVVAALL